MAYVRFFESVKKSVRWTSEYRPGCERYWIIEWQSRLMEMARQVSAPHRFDETVSTGLQWRNVHCPGRYPGRYVDTVYIYRTYSHIPRYYKQWYKCMCIKRGLVFRFLRNVSASSSSFFFFLLTFSHLPIPYTLEKDFRIGGDKECEVVK